MTKPENRTLVYVLRDGESSISQEDYQAIRVWCKSWDITMTCSAPNNNEACEIARQYRNAGHDVTILARASNQKTASDLGNFLWKATYSISIFVTDMDFKDVHYSKWA